MQETTTAPTQAATIDPTPTMNAGNLARLAEWADGLRDQDLVVVMKDGVPQLKVRAGGDAPILKVHTGNNKPNRRRPRVTFEAPGYQPEPIEEQCDSLFWTESAVEKFVFPYYATQRLLTDEEMREFRRRFLDDEDAVAVLHTPPTRSLIARAGLDSIKILRAEVDEDGTPVLVSVTLAEYLA